MKFLQVILVPFLISTTAHAQLSVVACPAVKDLKFTPISKDHYEVRGVSELISGTIPIFPLTGETTTASTAQNRFVRDQFVRQNEQGNSVFSCEYQSTDNQGNIYGFTLTAINAPWVKWCHIEHHMDNQCFGNRLECLLSCEML